MAKYETMIKAYSKHVNNLNGASTIVEPGTDVFNCTTLGCRKCIFLEDERCALAHRLSSNRAAELLITWYNGNKNAICRFISSLLGRLRV